MLFGQKPILGWTPLFKKQSVKEIGFWKFIVNVYTPTSWLCYKRQRNYTTSVIRDAKRAYYNKLNIQLINHWLSKRKWWSYIRSNFNKNQSSIPAILEGTELVSDAKKKAEIFNEYSASQAIVDDTNTSLPEMVNFNNRQIKINYRPISLLFSLSLRYLRNLSSQDFMIFFKK